MAKRVIVFSLVAWTAALHAAPMDAFGEGTVSVIQDVKGYNSWPMIQAVGGKLVCAYSRGSAHTIGEGDRSVYARTSFDCGKTWGPEVCVANDPSVGEVTIGKGLDSKGAMLLWVRCWGKNRHHDLYRTADGATFERISTPTLDPMPMQITDVFPVPGVGLMSLWFAGDYQKGPRSSWGILTSKDDGRTWTQRTVEKNLEKNDWPTEQAGVWLGNGRILVVARSEESGQQFQITSVDNGTTWKRTKTNITDVNASTPSLILDPQTRRVANYYYHRGARKMKRRTADAAWIFDHPMEWPAPETLAEGHEKRAWDAGNVNATVLNGRHFLATYTGSEHDTSVVVVALPAPTAEVDAERQIEFENPLPRMRCGKVQCGTYNNPELSLPGVLTTSDARLGMFLQTMRTTILANRRLLFIDGRVVVCNHNWIRDHVQQMKGWKHWEYDPLSFLQLIIDTQRADGQFFELVKQMDDFHWKMVDEDCRRLYPADNLSLVRLELEADVEYLVVEGAWTYYKTTGDDDWLRRVLPALEKGIDYQTSDPKRWSAKFGLVTRPYTIDTWDFTADYSSQTNRRVLGTMCAMHGDNTGVYQAMGQLAWMNERLGNTAKAADWRRRAATLKANVMRHLWNGRYFVHQFPVDGNPSLDGNEASRLSLSDSYALNRGILSGDECRAVIDAFRERRKATKAFAEWFTVDPPYAPSFMRYKPGQYVNGAVSPFTAGELAKGAFANGREAYGWDIICRMMAMVERDKAIYFLYDPLSQQPQGGGPSAWGAAAMMNAVDEGLAGIVNGGVGYDEIVFSPRWPVTHYREIRYVTGCELTRKFVDCRWIATEKGMRYRLQSPAKKVSAHLLVPFGKVPKSLRVNGAETAFAISTVGESRYVDATVVPQGGVADFEVLYVTPTVRPSR